MADLALSQTDESISPSPRDESTSTEPAGPNSRVDVWRSRIAKCRSLRRQLVTDWSTNVDYRRGKQFETDSDQDRIAITVDWSATKAKQSELFSQVPEVRLTPKDKRYQSGVPIFGKKLNDTLNLARVGVAMDECLPDCINAAGVGAVLISYEARMETATIPAVPPEIAAQLQLTRQAVPTKTIQRPASSRINIARISPSDFLWPVDFTGSDFEDAAFKGRSGRMPWSAAKHEFRLTDADKDRVTGVDDRSNQDVLAKGDEHERYRDPDTVCFEEIFYKRYLFHPDEMSFEALHRLVFVHGKNEPVIDEPWKGQQRAVDGVTILGSCKSPIQVLTLTYLSDECIPPSDTAMGRPQVDELIRSRSQMIRQRENSLPIRWFDVNRVAPGVQDTLQRGTWQGMIPMNGNGNNAIGEVVRANYPREDFEFDRVAKSDLAEAWQVSGAQLYASGGPSPRSATESQITQTNFATRIGYERARVVRFFVAIAEVVAGLLALYGKFTPEEAQALDATWNRKEIAGYYVYTVRADSTVLLDAQQRIERLMTYLNMVGKSGFVNVEPIIREITELSGLNPDEVVQQPTGAKPKPLNVSLRVSGTEDLNNPIVLALLMKTGQAPTPEELDAAKKMLLTAQAPVEQPEPVLPQPPLPGAPPPPVPAPGDANPAWNTMTRIDTRSEMA